MPLAQGQVLNNRYRIVSLLGEGGFGAVYKAWDTKLNGPCALKENFGTTPEAERQFAKEASILFNLRHPGLPMVFDYFSVANQGQYLVMVYVEGSDLQQILDGASDPLPESMVLPWISQACDALSYLHSQKPPIIHRDIKPANIKITPDGQAVLVDFGIAKVYDSKLKTTVGARAITPGFSPPEQYGRGRTDPRTDIYALGATLYTLLTKVEPPDSVDLLAGNEPPIVNPSVLNAKISPFVDASITKSMQLDRGQRFQTAQEFKASLKSLREPPQPAQASGFPSPPAKVVTTPKPKLKPPPPLGKKSPPKRRRKPWLIPLIAISAILILAFLVYQVPPIKGQVNNLFGNLEGTFNEGTFNGSGEKPFPPPDADIEGEFPPAEPLNVRRFDVPVGDNPILGDFDAPVTLVMFGDYEDDQSRGWHLEFWPRLQETYGGQVRLVYLDYPQERIHPESFSAALAANCAWEQEHFWEYHDRLYSFHLGLGPEAYFGYAEELRLNLEHFRDCLENERTMDNVIRDIEAAQALDINSAPVFFINGIRLDGIKPYEVFANMIERELRERP